MKLKLMTFLLLLLPFVANANGEEFFSKCAYEDLNEQVYDYFVDSASVGVMEAELNGCPTFITYAHENDVMEGSRVYSLSRINTLYCVYSSAPDGGNTHSYKVSCLRKSE